MKLRCKLIGWALLATAISPVVVAYAAGQPVQPKPAACHEHGRRAPGPGTYQCCRGGHQFAAVREAVEIPSQVLTCRVIESVVPAWATLASQTRSRPPAPGSPGFAALRI